MQGPPPLSVVWGRVALAALILSVALRGPWPARAVWPALQVMGLLNNVVSAGIVCVAGCPARVPLLRNVLVHRSVAMAEAEGFRRCQRCLT